MLANAACTATPRQTLMFTATWPDSVKKIAEGFTGKDAVHVRIGDNGERLAANKSINQIVEVIDEVGGSTTSCV